MVSEGDCQQCMRIFITPRMKIVQIDNAIPCKASFIALPGPPTNVRVSEITAASVRLSWSYNEPEDLQYYVIQFKPKYANQAFSEISGIITMYYSVRNLSPYTEYEMYVIAVNNIGRGPPSAPVVVTTGETAVGEKFENLKTKNLQLVALCGKSGKKYGGIFIYRSA
ncbi:tyrosine-protein phosphatase Lar-like [Anoplophora glabripennis]|uniref:tyrosine-protein phosphatase Lar-like n=1 Tax=Anoplophora glabripennis TaxID=217634 RepID=UPI000875314F|nr:tyrosine-protein phosphatase Lar-like [Anoplophora glabripennis]